MVVFLMDLELSRSRVYISNAINDVDVPDFEYDAWNGFEQVYQVTTKSN